MAIPSAPFRHGIRRRYMTLAVAVTVMVIVVAAQRREQPALHVLRVTCGLRDQKPSDWSGKVQVDGGEVVSLEGWRFEGQDRILNNHEWQASTHTLIAPGQVFRLETPGKPKPTSTMAPWPNGITMTIRGEKPAMTVIFPSGKVQFRGSDVKLGEPKSHLNGAVHVERLPETKRLRPPAPERGMHPYQDDYPAFWIRYRTNTHYLAWVCYQNGKDRVLLVERDGADGDWSEPIEVAGPGDHFRVALASTHQDDLWVVWSSQQNGNWDLFARSYKNGKLEDVVRITDAPGPDIWHRMTTDSKGRAWLVWQGFRDGQSDIFVRCADGDGWHPPMTISDSPANDWDPTITADTREDRVWIGWDTYDPGYYDIRLRALSDGPQAKLSKVDEQFGRVAGNFNAHVSLACDQEGRLWMAWDEADKDWGKDAGFFWQEWTHPDGKVEEGLFARAGTRLFTRRNIQVRVRDQDNWVRPRDFQDGLPPETRRYHELPQLQADSAGRMWLAFRARTCKNPREDDWAAQGQWDAFAVAYVGNRWTAPIPLPHSTGRNDMRISSQGDRDGSVYFAYASDNRPWSPPPLTERNVSVAVSRMSVMPQRRADRIVGLPATRVGEPERQPVHPDEKTQVARVRNYKIEHAGKTYRIYRGDLHRHTDISIDGVGDGSLMDLHRYALDAAAFDFILVGDHNMGNDREYPWWRTQKANDLYVVPGKFISMYGYERSVRYPNGHRNVIWTERGHRTLPLPNQAIPAQMAADTGRLYAYLRQTGGICTAHTSATEQGTDWKEFDGSLEPIVEIFQGFHTSYEAEGAPLAIHGNSKIVHQGFRPLGFVSKALETGYKVGFQCSSDHVSTHVSYACVIAEEFSRKGLVEAMKKRHTYGATDNIILDVRAGKLGIMGDEISTNQPRLDVTVIGTGNIDRAEVIRNGKVIYTAKPDKDSEELRFSWEDQNPERGKTSYYYVRVIQQNRHMAWGSPIWVRLD